MGYIVAGYCHSDLTQARLHFADIVVSYGRDVGGQPGNFATILNPNAGSLSTGQVSVTSSVNISSPTVHAILTLPLCDTAFHDGPMPWGVSSAESPDFLEAHGLELVSVALIVFWLGRIAGRQK